METIKVFIAGSKSLSIERDAVRAVLSSLNNIVPIASYSFEDFERSLTPEGRQADYNAFIRDEADYVIFIIDQGVGKITLEEFDVAMNTYKEAGRPEIFVFLKINNELSPEKNEVIRRVNELKQYYTEYYDVNNLKALVKEDFYKILLNKTKVSAHKPVAAPVPKYKVVETVKKLHVSLINATKSILSMVQNLADTGNLSFPNQVAATSDLMDNMQMASFVLPKHIYAEIERFAINYPQKGYNTVLNILRERVNQGVASLNKSELEALHSELLKAMPVEETQDKLNALIHTIQDYCNSL